MTLIDLKEFFEYTPGVLRLLVEPSHLSNIAKPLPSRRCKSVVAEVVRVDAKSLQLRHQPSGELTTLSFDYLILACGSLYPATNGRNVIKSGVEQPTLEARAAVWQAAASDLDAAESVLVVGGGPVGVELAAEIACVHPHKRVTLVSRSERLCADLPEAVGDHCLAWLRSRGVEVLSGVGTTGALSEDGATLSDGRTLSGYDAVYNCAGGSANTRMLQPTFSSHLDPKGRLIVNDHMQVAGHPRVFGIGDMMIHERSGDLKLGHTAELNAHVAVENVCRLADADADGAADLVSYPEFTSLGLARSPRVFCVSLGKHSAVMAFNGLVLAGWMPALLKWGLEWTKVAACAERPIGTLFWEVADLMTALITRVGILPVPPPPMRAKSAKIE